MASEAPTGGPAAGGKASFRVLGPLQAHRGDDVVPLGGARQRTLLAALLAHAGEVVSVDVLAEALWGGSAPDDPRNAVQTSVSRLRGALGGDTALVTRSPGYVLDVEPEQVDALRFDRLLTEARRARDRPGTARQLLDEALALWRGPAYAGFADTVAQAEARRLEEQRLVAIEARAQVRLALGEGPELIGELGAVVAEHPLRERPVELLMRALTSAGRQAEALATYREYRGRLADETGLEPTRSIEDLQGRILRGDPVTPRPTVETPSKDAIRDLQPDARHPSTVVPPATTSLVGRGAEIDRAHAALEDHRVVTLTGTGGVGKTRIAAAVAERLGQDGNREVAWIELAPLTGSEAIDHVVATALGIDLSGGGSPRDAVVGALATRSTLLVLDNCEHLLDAVAALVDQVQRTSPGVRVLTTSRERLAIDGERVLPVEPLPVDTDHAADGLPAAVRLFMQRAADAGAALDAGNDLVTVTAICRELDGLPLAIELAAARTNALSLPALLTRLREDAPTAAGRRRSQPERHRDLWAVTDWSYRQLDPTEQRLFERMSVFAGPAMADEVHEVCADPGRARADTVEQLTALVERSLVIGPRHGSDRYRMLRPLRAFARQRLADRGEAGTVADRHTRVLTARVEYATGSPMTYDDHRWLDSSLDDIREVARRARLAGDAGILGRLVAALYWYDQWRAGGELLGWADELVEDPAVDDLPTAPGVHAAAAVRAWMRGDLVRAGVHARRAVTLGDGADDRLRSIAFAALADVTLFEGQLTDAEAAFREQARLAAITGDVDGEAIARAGVAIAHAYTGATHLAIREADEAGRLAEQSGPAATAFVRYAQGECHAEAAPQRAIALLDEAATIADGAGARFIEDVARLTAATLRARHDDPRRALPLLAELVDRWRRSGSWTQQWTTLRNLAEVLVRLELDPVAVTIAAAADADVAASSSFGTEADRLRAALELARDRLGEEGFQAAWSRGTRLPRQEVVDLVLDTLRGHTGT